MRPALSVAPSVLMLSVVAGALSTSVVWAEPGTISPPLTVEECLALRDQYVQAYEVAKTCTPRADYVPQCTKWVVNDLICGCPGYVNTRHKLALKIMDTAKQQFMDAGCSGFWDCTAGFCPGVYESSCVGEGAQGTCLDWSGW